MDSIGSIVLPRKESMIDSLVLGKIDEFVLPESYAYHPGDRFTITLNPSEESDPFILCTVNRVIHTQLNSLIKDDTAGWIVEAKNNRDAMNEVKKYMLDNKGVKMYPDSIVTIIKFDPIIDNSRG